MAGLLTSKAPREWNYIENAISDIFTLVPATIEGLGELAKSFDQINKRDQEYWIRSSNNGVYITKDLKLEEQLANKKEIFYWVCAATAYPRIYWELTLHLGKALETKPRALVNQENLDILTRIKWFKEGEIKTQERIAYLEKLPKIKEEKVRKAILDLLSNKDNRSVLPHRNAYAMEEYRQQLIRNQIPLEVNKKKKIRKLEKLRTIIDTSTSIDPEAENFLDSEYALLDRIAQNLVQNLFQIGSNLPIIRRRFAYMVPTALAKIRFPANSLENELDIRFLRNGIENQVGTILIEFAGEYEGVFEFGGPQIDVLQEKFRSFNQKYIPQIRKSQQTPSIDQNETQALLESWDVEITAETENFISNFEFFSFSFHDIIINELDPKKTNEYLNHFLFEDFGITDFVDGNKTNLLTKFFKDRLLFSDWLTNSVMRLKVIDKTMLCRRIRIYGNDRNTGTEEQLSQLEISFGENVYRPITFTTRSLQYFDDYLSLDIPLDGNWDGFSEKIRILPLADSLDKILPTLRPWSEDLREEKFYVSRVWMEMQDDENFTQSVLHFFNPGGEYLVSKDGDSTTGNWRYLVSSNKLVISSSEGLAELFELQFLDSQFFILKKHGSPKGVVKSKYLVMVNESLGRRIEWYLVPELISSTYGDTHSIARRTKTRSSKESLSHQVEGTRMESLVDSLDKILPGLRPWSEDLREEKFYIGRSWMELSDDENFIKSVLHFFNPGGEYMVSLDGNVAYGQWRYLDTSNKLLINMPNEDSKSFILAFLDDSFFILRRKEDRIEPVKPEYLILVVEAIGRRIEGKDIPKLLRDQYQS